MHTIVKSFHGWAVSKFVTNLAGPSFTKTISGQQKLNTRDS